MSKTDLIIKAGDFAIGCAVRHVENMMAPIEAALDIAAHGKLSSETTDRMFNSLVSQRKSDLADHILKK